MVQPAPLIAAATDPLTVSLVTTLIAASPLAAWGAFRRAKPGAQLDTVRAMEALVEQHRKDAKDAKEEVASATERAERAELRAQRAEERVADLEDRIDALELRLRDHPSGA